MSASPSVSRSQSVAVERCDIVFGTFPPASISTGQEIAIPTEFWNINADESSEDSLSRSSKEEAKWKRNIHVQGGFITGKVKWIGTIPGSVGALQFFSGIETDIPLSEGKPRRFDNKSGNYANEVTFDCKKDHGVFLPVEFFVKQPSKIRESPARYNMKASPHGIALIIVNTRYHKSSDRKSAEADADRFRETFESLSYRTKVKSDLNKEEILKAFNKVANVDHTRYDSFVCCISSKGCNDHYLIDKNEKNDIDIYELVDIIQQCPSLQGKPKLFFCTCNRNARGSAPKPKQNVLGPDTLIVWATQKDKVILFASRGSIFPMQLQQVMHWKSRSTDLFSMLIDVSTYLSLIRPMHSNTTQNHQGNCCEIESTLEYNIYFHDNDIHGANYDILLKNALKQGKVLVRYSKVALCGPTGSGKTAVLNLLHNQEPVMEHDSTPLAVAPDLRVIKANSLGASSTESMIVEWDKVDYASMKKMIAKQLKHIGTQTLNEDDIRPEEPPASMDENAVDIPYIDTAPIDGKRAKSPKPLVSSEYSEVLQHMSHEDGFPSIENAHWIYAIDSGGQAAFLDVAPALLRFNTTNIFTIKLNEDFDSKVKSYYSLNGKLIGEPKEQLCTNIELLVASFRSLTSSALSDPSSHTKVLQNEGGSCLVVGTHLDKLEESEKRPILEQKNKKLRQVLSHFHKKIIHYSAQKGNIIFPLNAISREKHEQTIATRLRQEVTKSYIEAEVPIHWYMFQVDLKNYETETCKIISIQKCYKIGACLFMRPPDVQAALQFFHDLTIFLYFPDDIPDIVFLHPQPLFDILSDLVSISFADVVRELRDANLFLPPGAHENLKFNGTFTKDVLSFLPRKFPDGFLPDDFLTLMQSLFIIAHLEDEDKYLLPYVLVSQDIPSFLMEIFSEKFDPIVLTWDLNPLPVGLFPALVVYLINNSHFCMQLLEDSNGKPIHQYRNAVRLDCIDLGGSVMLIDAIYWLEVYYTGDENSCQPLLNVVEDGIKKVIAQFKFTLEAFQENLNKCFLCKIKHDNYNDDLPPHLSKQVNDCTYACCIDDSLTIPIDVERQLPWFGTVADIDDDILNTKPDLNSLLDHLLYLEVDEWDELCKVLKFSESFSLSLSSEYGDDFVRLICIIEEWLKSDEITWNTVISTLIELGRDDLAEEIRSSLIYN